MKLETIIEIAREKKNGLKKTVEKIVNASIEVTEHPAEKTKILKNFLAKTQILDETTRNIVDRLNKEYLNELNLHGFENGTDFLKFLKERINNSKGDYVETKFKGDLFEHLVHHLKQLDYDCRITSEQYVRSINEAIGKDKENVINVKGDVIPIDSPFSKVIKVSSVSLKKLNSNELLDFSDIIYVSKSVSKKTGKALWTICLVLEAKTFFSAKDFTLQIGEFLERVCDPDLEHIEFKIEETGEKLKIKPEDLIFYTKEINQVAVSTFSEAGYNSQLKKLGESNPYKNARFRVIDSFEPEPKNKPKKKTPKIPIANAIRIDLLMKVQQTNKLVNFALEYPQLGLRRL